MKSLGVVVFVAAMVIVPTMLAVYYFGLEDKRLRQFCIEHGADSVHPVILARIGRMCADRDGHAFMPKAR